MHNEPAKMQNGPPIGQAVCKIIGPGSGRFARPAAAALAAGFGTGIGLTWLAALPLTTATAPARLLCWPGNRILGSRAAGDRHFDLHQLFDLAQQIGLVGRAEGDRLAFTTRT